MLCGQNIQWTTRGRDFFCRTGDSSVQTIWCQPAHPQVPSCFRHLKTHQSARNILLSEFEKRNLWRFLPLEDGRELLMSLDFVLMRHQGASFWLRLEWLEPLFHDLNELMFGKIKHVSWVEDRLQDGAEDWKLAIRCQEQKDWWSRMECAKGSIGQLRRLMESYVVIWGNSISNRSVKDLRLQTLLQPLKGASPEQQRVAQQIGMLLDRHFRLQEKDIAGRIYVESGKSVERVALEVKPSADLSQHERLHAISTWHDFLRDKMTLEEIEALLKI
ncbi:hypothetical protein IAD21_03206 [Abditibacteriota bacterium]|nr:hypothetical protein IAD21_03206 [Abditibacteriota bacterium]